MNDNPTTNVLDLIPHQDELIARENEKRRTALKSEIKLLLSEIDKCCPSDGDVTKWPTKEQLAQLQDAVFSLSPLVKANRPRSIWNRYRNVDRHFGSLDLCASITSLISRASKHTPIRPLERFRKLSHTSEANAVMVDTLLKYFEAVIRDGHTHPKEGWDHFVPLFYDYQKRTETHKPYSILKPKNYKADGSPGLVAYTVFLELCCEDAAWRKKHFKGRETLRQWALTLNYPALFKDWENMYEFPTLQKMVKESIESSPKLLNKKKAALRQRKKRSKDRLK